jgi:fructoselysine-6-P-deglycase FrlB-like protein
MTIDPSYVSREIARQPAAWVKAEDLLADVAGLLPQPGERVAVIGCGTSWFIAAAYAVLREMSGAGETDAFAASQLPVGRSYDRILAISRSGTTTEVLRAINGTTSPVTALTAVADAPLSAAAGAAIVLEFADEQSVVQTLFATTALMLLRASLGEAIDQVVTQARSVLAGGHPLDPMVDLATQFSFVGQGWAAGVASEAALKMREAARAWTESYPQMEYRHGPISIAEPGRVVWVFGAPVPGLLDDLAATGVTVVDDDLDPVADLIRVQLLSVRLAAVQGLDPDRPRNLTRSVVLTGPEPTR